MNILLLPNNACVCVCVCISENKLIAHGYVIYFISSLVVVVTAKVVQVTLCPDTHRYWIFVEIQSFFSIIYYMRGLLIRTKWSHVASLIVYRILLPASHHTKRARICAECISRWISRCTWNYASAMCCSVCSNKPSKQREKHIYS